MSQVERWNNINNGTKIVQRGRLMKKKLLPTPRSTKHMWIFAHVWTIIDIILFMLHLFLVSSMKLAIFLINRSCTIGSNNLQIAIQYSYIDIQYFYSLSTMYWVFMNINMFITYPRMMVRLMRYNAYVYPIMLS